MKLTVLLTILAIIFGYICLVLPEVAAPFLAVFLIYFVWKAYDFNRANEKLQKELEEIKSLLQQRNETEVTTLQKEETQTSIAEPEMPKIPSDNTEDSTT